MVRNAFQLRLDDTAISKITGLPEAEVARLRKDASSA
jgi:hypothetical protein